MILVFGAGVIYFYLFKFRKYNKEDIIAWVEYGRDIINKENNLENVRNKLIEANLPQDFINIVMKKLK